MGIFNGDNIISDIYLPILMVVLLIAYSWVSRQIIKFAEVKMELKLRENFRVLITQKRAKLKFKHVENQATWDLISRVTGDPEQQCGNTFNNFLSIISLSIRVAGLLFVLFTQVWWTSFLILLISILLFALAIKSGKATYETNREASKYRRKSDYLEEFLKGRESVEERALFGYSKAINKKWWNQYEIARKIEFKTKFKWFIKMKMGSIIIALISILIVL